MWGGKVIKSWKTSCLARLGLLLLLIRLLVQLLTACTQLNETKPGDKTNNRAASTACPVPDSLLHHLLYLLCLFDTPVHCYLLPNAHLLDSERHCTLLV